MASRCLFTRVSRQLLSTTSRKPMVGVQQRLQQRAFEERRRLFSVSSMLKEKKYTEDHEWIEASPDGKTYTLGISTYAASQLGDVVFIELPAVDTQYSAGDAIGAVESVKSASDILTPVSGKVVEINDKLEKKPADVNRDPEGEAWIAKIEFEGEIEGRTMSKDEYKAFTEDS